MTPNEVARVIRRWFDSIGGGTLILPDGWFGRPYDNFHCLTDLRLVGDDVRLELDNQLVLVFTTPRDAKIVNSQLVVKDFESLAFHWEEFGNKKKHSSTYQAGAVTFVPPLGSRI